MQVQKNNLKAVDEFEVQVQNAAKISTEETMKELVLQKEDTKIKKIIAQVKLLIQIQKKKKENHKLEMTLQKLVERRKIITSALKQQKQIADEKRRMVLVELERQKEHIFRLKEQEKKDSKEKSVNLRQIQNLPRNETKSKTNHGEEISQKTKILKAHNLLVNKSNERILGRLEDIRLKRQKEAIAKQETLRKEQQKQRLREQKASLKIRPTKTESLRTKVTKEIKLTTSLLSNLNKEKKKQILEWLDLERDSAILEITDKAIAEKMKAKNFVLSLLGNDEKDPSSAKVMSAEQVLINSGNFLQGDDSDDILGFTGLDNTESDKSELNDPPIIASGNKLILDLDKEYDFSDYADYNEYEYDYEYEDEASPAVAEGYEF